MAESGQEVTGRGFRARRDRPRGRIAARRALSCAVLDRRHRHRGRPAGRGRRHRPGAAPRGDAVRQLRHGVLGMAAARPSSPRWPGSSTARPTAMVDQPGPVPFPRRRARSAGTWALHRRGPRGDHGRRRPASPPRRPAPWSTGGGHRRSRTRSRPPRRSARSAAALSGSLSAPKQPATGVRVRMVASAGPGDAHRAPTAGSCCWTPPWPCGPASPSSTTSPCRGRSSGRTGCGASSWAAGPSSSIRRSQA